MKLLLGQGAFDTFWLGLVTPVLSSAAGQATGLGSVAKVALSLAGVGWPFVRASGLQMVDGFTSVSQWLADGYFRDSQ